MTTFFNSKEEKQKVFKGFRISLGKEIKKLRQYLNKKWKFGKESKVTVKLTFLYDYISQSHKGNLVLKVEESEMNKRNPLKSVNKVNGENMTTEHLGIGIKFQSEDASK